MNQREFTIGSKAPAEVNVVIEIIKGSAIKYEMAESGNLKVDRVIGSASAYPCHYGFIPQTLAPDGDALDALVISDAPADLKSVIACRVIGLLEMEDEQGGDNKILCVPVGETGRNFSGLKDIADLDVRSQEKIKLFFSHYKEMEKSRWSKVQNFRDKAAAYREIERSWTAAK